MECLRDQFKEGVVLDGRYQTIAPLNHGSFGMVFMAGDLKTNETVAIKCLTKKSAATEAGLDFAIDDKSEELILHRRLGRHPNIVNLIGSFETDAHVYLVIEFCPRGDLYEAIRNGHGPLETEHVRCFMLELVDAVAYIHSKGIYHRDIKPENIFLTQAGAMKLGDFGLATTERWTYETTVGSDRYMSPEQYDSAGAGYSPRPGRHLGHRHLPAQHPLLRGTPSPCRPRPIRSSSTSRGISNRSLTSSRPCRRTRTRSSSSA